MLKAIAAQEGDFPREFIFIDDGSTDRSVEILRSVTKDWPDTRIVIQKNQGPSGSTNAGCRLARLPWIKLLGSDDILAPFATALLLKAVRDAGAAAIYSHQRFYRKPGDVAFDRAAATRAEPEIVEDALSFVMRHNLSGTSGTLFSKEAFEAAGGCDERVFAEDFSLCLRIAHCRDIALLDAVTCYGPADEPGRIMTGRKNQLLHDYNAALYWFLKDHPELPLELQRLAFRRAAGRAWKWASREEKQGFTARYAWLNAWSYAPLGCDYVRAVGQTMDAFAISRPVKPGHGLSAAAE